MFVRDVSVTFSRNALSGSGVSVIQPSQNELESVISSFFLKELFELVFFFSLSHLLEFTSEATWDWTFLCKMI